MNYVLSAFRIALLQKLRSVKTWLPVVLLPLLVWSCLTFLPAQERTAPVQVGVAYPEEGAEQFRALLELRSGTIVTFIPAEEDAIRGKVSTGQWDCGLILADDFQSRVTELELDKLITLCIGEGSTVYPLVREAVAACMAELTAPGMAHEYMRESGLYRAETAELADALLARVLTEEDRILISVETASGGILSAPTLADDAWNAALCGLIAIVVLIWQLFAAVDLGRWLETREAMRQRPLRSVSVLLLPRAAAAMLPCLVSASLALCLLPGGASALLPLCCYLLALAALALLAARARTVWTALPLVMPILPIVCLLLSPIIVDFGAFFPVIAPLQRAVPVTMFLRACSGSGGNAALLAAIGVLALLCSLAADAAALKRMRAKTGGEGDGYAN